MSESKAGEGGTVTVTVVGAGLAGLCASIAAAKNGARVTVLEKAGVGGNSAKASSGMNAVGTPAQTDAAIDDSYASFMADTVASCGAHMGDEALLRTLTELSTDAEAFLSGFGLHLSALSQCGGHSVPRTHRFPAGSDGKTPPVGFTIIRALEAHIRGELSDSVSFQTGCTVSRLIEGTHPIFGRCVEGVVYHDDAGEHRLESDAVVLTTGGFGFSEEAGSLRARHTPWLAGIPTTNGSFATGDGVRLGEAAGATTADMDKVQVHPTAFVDPADPGSRTKFLAPEALRATGGILINPTSGRRFVNELSRRDVVSGAMFKVCPELVVPSEHPVASPHYRAPGDPKPCYSLLVMTEKTREAMGSTFDFYLNVKKFITRVESAAELAEMLEGVPDAAGTLTDEFAKYTAAAAAHSDDFDKHVFPDNFSTTTPLYVAKVMPAVHYTMGGLRINASAEVLRFEPAPGDFFDAADPMEPAPATLKSLPRLFAAGEVTGGIHCRNRLAGSSLLECVVFGRIAGERAAKVRAPPSLVVGTDHFVPIRFREMETLVPDVYLVRFDLPSSLSVLNCGLGKYVNLRAVIGGESVERSYSPMSRPSDRGVVEFLIKCDTTSGLMSKHLTSLKPGDVMELRGPIDGPEIDLARPGLKLGLIAGGTGVAPMTQILREVFYTGSTVHVDMILASPRPDMVPFYELLTRKSYSHPNFNLTCTVDATAGLPWADSVGFVNAGLIKASLPPPGEGVFIVVCGPPPMCRAVKRALASTGYTEDMFYSYL